MPMLSSSCVVVCMHDGDIKHWTYMYCKKCRLKYLNASGVVPAKRRVVSCIGFRISGSTHHDCSSTHCPSVCHQNRRQAVQARV